MDYTVEVKISVEEKEMNGLDRKTYPKTPADLFLEVPTDRQPNLVDIRTNA